MNMELREYKIYNFPDCRMPQRPSGHAFACSRQTAYSKLDNLRLAQRFIV